MTTHYVEGAIKKLSSALDILLKEKGLFYCNDCQRWHTEEEKHNYCNHD